MTLVQNEPKKIYIYVDIPVITTAGIYHNADLGLISLSSDGENWLTIADKNLGATTVWNSGDTLSESNCGKYYQRGNNYGFPRTGVSSSSTSQVNTVNYGPNNYYSSSTFISRTSSPRDWSSNINNNLRGDTTNTLVARKGPCDTGYHVPTKDEIISLVSLCSTLGGTTGAFIVQYLKRPIAGYIDKNTTLVHGTQTLSWTSSSDGNSCPYRRAFIESQNIAYMNPNSYTNRLTCDALSIRPFKNEAVQPDTSWTVLYQPS